METQTGEIAQQHPYPPIPLENQLLQTTPHRIHYTKHQQQQQNMNHIKSNKNLQPHNNYNNNKTLLYDQLLTSSQQKPLFFYTSNQMLQPISSLSTVKTLYCKKKSCPPSEKH